MIQPTITNIMERFDFEKVRALMFINNWHWHGEREPPSIEEMQEKVYGLYRSMCSSDRPNTRISTGGFVLSRWEWDSCVELELSFVWEKTGETRSRDEKD